MNFSLLNKKLMKLSKFDSFQRKDFIDLITKLNAKIVFLQREKSKQSIEGKTVGYKATVSKHMIMQFLQKDCTHNLDDVQPITDYNLKDFRDRLSQFDDNLN
jgi:hypothetical protein